MTYRQHGLGLGNARVEIDASLANDARAPRRPSDQSRRVGPRPGCTPFFNDANEWAAP